MSVRKIICPLGEHQVRHSTSYFIKVATFSTGVVFTTLEKLSLCCVVAHNVRLLEAPTSVKDFYKVIKPLDIFHKT